MRNFPVLGQLSLASLITSLSVVFGVTGMLFLLEGSLLPALLLGALALPCDVLDGKIARRTGRVTAFGGQLDSLADALSFGVLPALAGYRLGMTGILAPLLVWYVVGAVFRLARFGEVGLVSESPPGAGQGAGQEAFEGVPTPFMASVFYLVAALALWLPAGGGWLLCAFFLLGPLLMIARFSFPKHGAHTRLMWVAVPLAMLALCLRAL